MPNSLVGHTILIVEDEPFVVIGIASAFEQAGASVVSARSLAKALALVELEGLSAAILDFGQSDGDAEYLCHRLGERRVPYILHSGDVHVGRVCGKGIAIPKPASAEILVHAVSTLSESRR